MKESVVNNNVDNKKPGFVNKFSDNKNTNHQSNNKNSKPGNTRRRFETDLESKVLNIKRITKVTKGGRRFRFSVLVVIGDKKSKVGFAFGKSNEIPLAIKKAFNKAKSSLYHIDGIDKKNSSIYHDTIGKNCQSKVILKPAKVGKGLNAADSISSVLSLLGISNITSKIIGSTNKANVILATIKALKAVNPPFYYEKLRNFSERTPNYSKNNYNKKTNNQNSFVRKSVKSIKVDKSNGIT